MIKYEPWMDKKQILSLASKGLLQVHTEDFMDFYSQVWDDGWSKGYGRGFEDGYVQRDEELRQE